MPEVTGLIGSALAGWWELVDAQLCDPRHRFTFRDLLTGHCSMRRRTFERVGGFDESLRCHEDFDFGYRALQQGLSIRRIPGADARHHDASTLAKILARKRAEGRAGVQLAQRHPALARVLPLGYPPAGRLATLVQRAAVDNGTMAAVVPGACGAALRLLEMVRMRDKWRDILERLMDYWYWRGVREEAGSQTAVEALRSPHLPDEMHPALEIDLVHGLAAAETRLDAERPASLRVRLDGHLVGTAPVVIGAEGFRGVHLRPLLLKYMLPGYLQAAAAAGLMPEVLAVSVRQRASAEAAPAGQPTDQAA